MVWHRTLYQLLFKPLNTIGPMLLINITSSGHSQLNTYQLSRTAEGWKKCDISKSSTAYACLDQCGSMRVKIQHQLNGRFNCNLPVADWTWIHIPRLAVPEAKTYVFFVCVCHSTTVECLKMWIIIIFFIAQYIPFLCIYTGGVCIHFYRWIHIVVYHNRHFAIICG